MRAPDPAASRAFYNTRRMHRALPALAQQTDKPRQKPRIGRQFYDIWALLADTSVATLLTDTEMVRDILASVFEVSQAFGGDHPIPDGGFAASEAFNPSGEFAKDLRREHNTAMDTLHYGSERPTFDEVLERVHSCSKLLDPERD